MYMLTISRIGANNAFNPQAIPMSLRIPSWEYSAPSAANTKLSEFSK